MNVNAGFRGLAVINGLKIRCTEFGMNPQQSMLFYDHAIGLNDTVPGSPDTKDDAPGFIQTQKKYNRPSPIMIGGGLAFPASTVGDTDTPNFINLFALAKYGNFFDVSFNQWCSNGRRFIDCRVASFTFSVTAADIVNISAEIHAKNFVDTATDFEFTQPRKLITWDEVELSLIVGDSGGFVADDIQGLEFTINNNLSEVYTANPNPGTGYQDLLPKDLRLGMQEVSGTVSIYAKNGPNFLTPATGQLQMRLTVGSWFTDIYCVINPKQIQGIVGPVIITVPFQGVDKAFGA
jgi:hypothetical protein